MLRSKEIQFKFIDYINIKYLFYKFLKGLWNLNFMQILVCSHTSTGYVNSIAKVLIMMGGKNLFNKI